MLLAARISLKYKRYIFLSLHSQIYWQYSVRISTYEKKKIRNSPSDEDTKREKGRDLTRSYDKSPYIYRKIQKAT